MRRRLAGALPVAAALVALLAPPARAGLPQPVDPQFRDRAVLSEINAPMAVRFSPAGQVIVAQKSGLVRRFSGLDDTTGDVVVDLSREVDDYWDRGLLGLALDPGFDTNRRLYLLYTYDAPPGQTAPVWNDGCPDPPGPMRSGCVVSGRLVRVTLDAGGDPAKAQVTPLIAGEWCQQFPSHSIGTVAWGPDGMLYVSGGEGAHFWQTDWGQLGGDGPTPVNPCGDPSGEGGSLRSQDVRTSGDPTGLDGTVIRVDPETGQPGLVSPFSGDVNARRIIAYGLRNPFRMTFRPGTRELWIGDVGEERYEEIDRIPDAADTTAENFGWPCTEGPTHPAAWAGNALCSSLADSAISFPYYSYAHGSPVVAGDGCDAGPGASVSGLAFAGSGYPPRFDGALFFADYSRGCIWAMRAGANGLPSPSAIVPFAVGAPGAGPVDLQIGPGGDLYYAYFDPNAPHDGGVHRIEFAGSAPTARLTATPPDGPAPLTATLDASGSTDPDQQALTYAWDLDGDGRYDDATGAVVQHTFPAGDATVAVEVTDPDGLSDHTAVTVHAGNTPPVVAIARPRPGTTFAVGDTIAFSGSASDAQDGAEPASRLTWTLTIAHCHGTACHFHPLNTFTGTAQGTFTAPDHEYPSHLELRLDATDAGGLSSSQTVTLQPRPAQLRVETAPPGLAVGLQGGAPAPSPRSVTVFEGSSVAVAVAPAQSLAGVAWQLGGWEDGSSAAQRTVVARGDTLLRATFHRPSTGAGAPAPTPAAPLPVTTPAAPRLRVLAPARRSLARAIRVRAGCAGAPCALRATATVRSGALRRVLRPAARHAHSNRMVRLAFRLRDARAPARRALARGRRVVLRVVVTATGRDGRTATRAVTIGLR